MTEQLFNFCRSLIVQASTETRAIVDKARDGGELGPVQSEWEQAVKAPLIAKALDAYKSDAQFKCLQDGPCCSRGVEGDMLAAELKALIPHLSMLICNPQPSIRQAIADLMKTKTSAVLNVSCGRVE